MICRLWRQRNRVLRSLCADVVAYAGAEVNPNVSANACADFHADVHTFAGTYDCADVSANTGTHDSTSTQLQRQLCS